MSAGVTWVGACWVEMGWSLLALHMLVCVGLK